MNQQYISADDLDDLDETIHADMDNGALVAWRRDASGTQWYKRMPSINGVPSFDAVAADAPATMPDLAALSLDELESLGFAVRDEFTRRREALDEEQAAEEDLADDE